MRQLNIAKQLTRFTSFLLLAFLACQGYARNSGIDRLVVFGTSLSDTGNAFVWLKDPENSICGTLQNVPPYDGLDDLLIPDGPYAKGGHHFTNGATWVEGLARYLALAGNARPALQNDSMEASNYAVGGARAIEDFPCRFNLPAQVDAYLSDFGTASKDTLIVIEIGGNDVRDALVVALAGGDPRGIINTALSSLDQSIRDLYGHGARRFLVLNVPDIGKTPAVQILDQSSNAGGFIINQAGILSGTYNAGLVATVGNLKADLGDIDIQILDVHQIFDDVIGHPEDYGFSNATDACITPNQAPYKCAKPDEYVFWDGIHPTKAMHAIAAQAAISIVSTH